MDRKAWWALTIMSLAVGVAVGLHPAQPALGGGPQTKITVKEFVFSPKTITVPSGTDQFVVVNTGAVAGHSDPHPLGQRPDGRHDAAP